MRSSKENKCKRIGSIKKKGEEIKKDEIKRKEGGEKKCEEQ